ncbi:MAG: LysR family transcriptional regulator [Solirubrobacterales bacterium]
MLDVRRLRILREVAERGSFSAAADEMHLTQSAVSQQISALEKETGTKLLDRNHGNVRLTDPGATLVTHAEAVMARLDEAERELADIADLRGGRLRMVSFPTAGATIVAKAVPAFSRKYPEVELELGEAEPEESIPRLRAGDYDLALAYDFDTVPFGDDRDTERHFLLEERMQVALPADHPLAGERSVRLDQLAEETWACGVRPSSCRENVIQWSRSAGFEPRISFASDDYQVIQSLVAAGIGVALVPELLLTGRQPGISVLDVTPDAPVRRIWAITLGSDLRTPASEAMLEILHKEAGRLSRRPKATA